MVNGGSKVVVSVILRLAAGVWPLRYRDPDALPSICRARTYIISTFCSAYLTTNLSRSSDTLIIFMLHIPPMEWRLDWTSKLCTSGHAPPPAGHSACMHGGCMARWRGCGICRTMLNFSLATLSFPQLWNMLDMVLGSSDSRNLRPKSHLSSSLSLTETGSCLQMGSRHPMQSQ